MAEKQLFRIKSFFRKIYFKIYDLFCPPPPVKYDRCVHCWRGYPNEEYFIGTKKFENVNAEVRNTKGEKIRANLNWTVWLKVCRYCGDIPNLRPQKIIIHSNIVQPVWQDSNGNNYEKFEIPKDAVIKDVNKKKRNKPQD